MMVLAIFGAEGPAQAGKAARDPFWPVGYEPRDTTTVVVVAPKIPEVSLPVEPAKTDPLIIERMAKELQEKIKEQLKLTGFMNAGGRQLATVNGQVIGVNDHLSVSVEGTTYRFKVTGITPSSVKLEPVE
jgi:hypothetical protein